MRQDTVIWAPRRAALKEIEGVLARACRAAFAREMGVISPLFHAAPDHRRTAAAAQRLRLVTLENGDYQQIHNPADENFDELFAEWPRVMVHYVFRPLDPFAADARPRQAILECHDLDTNWDKAGWTTGTTLIHQDQRKDRHKILFGLASWDWPGRTEMETCLRDASAALVQCMGGTWEFLEGDEAGRVRRLDEYFAQQGRETRHEPDPMGEMRSLEDPDIGRL